MKKKTNLQTSLIALVTLFIGFFLGMAFTSISPSGDNLSGTIGRVDRHRNVQITEDDIILRNEFVNNLDLRDQYVDYLNYFYIKAMRTSADLYHTMDNVATVDAFSDVYSQHQDALQQYSNFLEVARTDILQAIGALVNIEAKQQRPMVELINQANNAILRMRNNDRTLVDFMVAIDIFMEQHDLFYDELADAHDLMAMSVVESAMAHRDKPLLSFLENKTMKNDEEGITKLMSELRSTSRLQEYNLRDLEILELHAPGFKYSNERLESIAFLNEATLRSFFSEGMQGQIQLRGTDDLIQSMDMGDLQGVASLRNMQALQSDMRIQNIPSLDAAIR